MLVGLTATPKEDVDANTFHIFGCEAGIPNYDYSLEDAIHDKYLVGYTVRPAAALSIALIVYPRTHRPRFLWIPLVLNLAVYVTAFLTPVPDAAEPMRPYRI